MTNEKESHESIELKELRIKYRALLEKNAELRRQIELLEGTPIIEDRNERTVTESEYQ